MILSAIAITMVVDAHSGTPINILYDIFTYNSFFMPLFMFISGYFFKSSSIENIGIYLRKKSIKLLIPLIEWNFLYGILLIVLKKCGIFLGNCVLSISTLIINPFSYCDAFGINGPSWFLGTLFLVAAVYAISKKIFIHWNEIVVLIIFIIAGMYSVWLCRNNYNSNSYMVILLRTTFFLQFYQLGVVYSKYLESYLKKINSVLYFGSLMMINIILLVKANGSSSLRFSSLQWMSGFQTDIYILPFITSLIGILFWIGIAEKLVPSIGNSKVVNYLSNNTLEILLHHVFFFNLLNVILGLINKKYILDGFDSIAARSDVWYQYNVNEGYKLLYFFVGISCPLLIKSLKDYVKKICMDKYSKVEKVYE